MNVLIISLVRAESIYHFNTHQDSYLFMSLVLIGFIGCIWYLLLSNHPKICKWGIIICIILFCFQGQNYIYASSQMSASMNVIMYHKMHHLRRIYPRLPDTQKYVPKDKLYTKSLVHDLKHKSQITNCYKYKLTKSMAQHKYFNDKHNISPADGYHPHKLHSLRLF